MSAFLTVFTAIKETGYTITLTIAQTGKSARVLEGG
jgi:hypothetical protein